jgi:predicted kinase
MKTLWMLLGPSGSGKSTLSDKIIRANPNKRIVVYSWDALRLDWYGDDYSKAWQASCDDRQFNNKAISEFQRLLDKEVDIIVDNVNLTPKSRKKFLTPAEKLGYKTVGVVFDVPLQTLINRQLTRPDKTVPTHAVAQQFNSFVHPINGEFDTILLAKDII